MDRCDACALAYDDLPRAELPDRLRLVAAAIADRITAADDASVRRAPGPGVWSPLGYACHVRDVLAVQRERVLLALEEDVPVFVPMGREQLAVDRRYDEQDPAVVARELRAAADALAVTLEALDDAGWERTGIYNYPEPTERDVLWLARHTVHEGVHHGRDVDDGLR